MAAAPPPQKERERERRERGERKRERKKKEKSKEKGPVIPRTCGKRPLAAPSDPQTSDHNSVSISRLLSPINQSIKSVPGSKTIGLNINNISF